jgi:uncharacterized phiE125 gp8 family phage protein
MSIKLISKPLTEPVSLDEAKNHLKIDVSPPQPHPDDALIRRHIKAARIWAENFQARAYISQTWRLTLDGFPKGERFISLPRPPLQYVTQISYFDGSATQTISMVDPSGNILETDLFLVNTDAEPGRICLKAGKSWPTAAHQEMSVQIEYVAGYVEAEDVPEDVKTAVLLRVGELYDNEQTEGKNSGFKEAAENFLWPDRDVPI